MLKFLSNRADDQPKRSPIKYKPEMIYGNSYEAPKEFQNQNSIIYRKSYLNPFLHFDKERKAKLFADELQVIEPKWKEKTHLLNVQEHKVINTCQQIYKEEPQSSYYASFHREYSGNPARFRMSRGQFSDFIEKNHHYKSIGPLHGKERGEERILASKQSAWIKPPSKKAEMTSSLKYASSMNTSLKSSIWENPGLLNEKQRIRKNRQKIQKHYQTSLERRKIQSRYAFDLPKDGPEHQIYLLEDLSRMPRLMQRSTVVGNLENEIESQELEAFERTLNKKFK